MRHVYHALLLGALAGTLLTPESRAMTMSSPTWVAYEIATDDKSGEFIIGKSELKAIQALSKSSSRPDFIEVKQSKTVFTKAKGKRLNEFLRKQVENLYNATNTIIDNPTIQIRIDDIRGTIIFDNIHITAKDK